MAGTRVPPFAGIIRIRFNGSAMLPHAPSQPLVPPQWDPVGSPNTLKTRLRRRQRQAGEIINAGVARPGVKLACNLLLPMCMKETGNFEVVEPFDMDDPSLTDISPQLAFILGVEWQMFRQRLKAGHPFTTLCLPQNVTRLVKMAEHHRRFVEDRPNQMAGWTEIFVGDEIAE